MSDPQVDTFCNDKDINEASYEKCTPTELTTEICVTKLPEYHKKSSPRGMNSSTRLFSQTNIVCPTLFLI